VGGGGGGGGGGWAPGDLGGNTVCAREGPARVSQCSKECLRESIGKSGDLWVGLQEANLDYAEAFVTAMN